MKEEWEREERGHLSIHEQVDGPRGGLAKTSGLLLIYVELEIWGTYIQILLSLNIAPHSESLFWSII